MIMKIMWANKSFMFQNNFLAKNILIRDHGAADRWGDWASAWYRAGIPLVLNY